MTTNVANGDARPEVAAGEAGRAARAVTGLEIETPSWGYGNSGTRFKVFPQPGVPRDQFEKIEDAATVGCYTGVAKSIALHIPWTASTIFGPGGVRPRARRAAWRDQLRHLPGRGLQARLAVPPSIEVRKKVVAHILACCEVARQTGSTLVKVWPADGTNYPGQDDFRARLRRLIESLREIYPSS